ncbi:DUF533 domain-containing protein [Tropicimonas sp. S265A]|uniref:DUF533 domain-containing protein n=1 Tax=Tropicimonas sp. S265A TaxID=3415134 RepID=UPI003C79B226
MSLKRMITKVALAFAAKKGAEMFRDVGGVKGMRDLLAGSQQNVGTQRGGMQGRIGGTRASATGGLGNLLESLGVAGATNGREAGVTGQMAGMGGSLGAILGQLASALGNTDRPTEVESLTRVDQGADAPLDKKTARAIIRAMVQTARADGQIDDDEREALLDLLEDAEDAERDILRDALSEPVDAQSVADDAPEHAVMHIYAAALLVATPANAEERAYLDRLADAMGLAPEARQRIENTMIQEDRAAQQIEAPKMGSE